MNKAELIATTAEKTGLSKKDTESVITAALMSSPPLWPRTRRSSWWASVPLRSRAALPVWAGTPKTKETIEIPASKVPVFKAGKALKDIVAK